MRFSTVVCCASAALMLVSASVKAYENENAVPLMVGLGAGIVTVEGISIKLDGRDVSIAVALKNGTTSNRVVRVHASTPQFSVLGSGEEHLDKSFSDVRAAFDGVSQRPLVYRRGFFMGRDITRDLVAAGLPPLPTLEADSKKLARVTAINGMPAEEWHGYLAYGWTASIPANSSTMLSLSYKSLPQFFLADVESGQLTQAVLENCGLPAAVKQRIRSTTTARQVLVERYVLPVGFMLDREVAVKIIQPATNWLEAHPLVSLICGLPNAEQTATSTGTVAGANLSLSILVVSALSGMPLSEDTPNAR